MKPAVQSSNVIYCLYCLNDPGHALQENFAGADLEGGGGSGAPPNGQSHSIKCSTTNVLRYAQALIYIAKSLVVVVVSSKRVVKPLSRQAVVQPEVLHLLECLLGHSTVLGLGSTR